FTEGGNRGARSSGLGQRPGDSARSRSRASVGLLGQEGGRDRPLAPRGLRRRDRPRLPAGRPMSAIVTEPFKVRSLKVVAETDAHEGPVYAADEHALYFTSVRRGTQVAITRLELATGRVDVLHNETNVANGMVLDREGRLVVCEQGTFETSARITRLDRTTGAIETVVDNFAGLPFNSPNDAVVAQDGAIWFTDPSYGHRQGFRASPRRHDAVYRHDA